MNSETSRSPVVQALRIAYLLAAAGLIAWLFINRGEDLAALVDGTRPAWLVMALLLSFGLFLTTSIIWRSVADAAGTTVGVSQLMHASARSVLGRYLPGSIWFAVGRIALLTSSGVPAAPLALAATAEMVLSVAVTIGLGAAILGLSGHLPGGALVGIVAAIAVVAIATPPLGGRLIGFVTARRNLSVAPWTWSAYLSVLGAVAGHWLWAALTFFTYLRAFPAADGFDPASVVGGFLFSWGIGFLAFIAPQGIGVFEVTLASIVAGNTLATVAVMFGGYRVLILVRDAVAVAAAEFTASPRAGRPSAPTD